MKTCLVVDDSKVTRKIASKMLVKIGFEVSESENGEVALDQCARKMPDIILLDWNMPVMDGMEFLKALRDTNLAPQPKIIFCTTESEFSKIEQALAAGADEYIMKPFDQEVLSTKLRLIGVI